MLCAKFCEHYYPFCITFDRWVTRIKMDVKTPEDHRERLAKHAGLCLDLKHLFLLEYEWGSERIVGVLL